MKKVLLINVYGGIGGAGQSFLDIVDSIDQTKFRLIVYSPAAPPAMAELLKSRGIEVITSDKPLPKYVHYSGASVTKLNMLFYIRSLSILTRGISELRKIIGQVRPDIIAVNSMTHAWVGPCIGKTIARICFVRETYLNTPLNLRTNLLKHWLVNHFEKVVFISEYDMRNTKGLKEDQGIVIRDSIRVTGEPYNMYGYREKLGLSLSDKYVLFVGGFDRIKGGDVLMNAISQIEDKSIKVLFLPVNPPIASLLRSIKTLLGLNYEKRIRDLIAKLRLENRILMFPPQTKVDDFYRAADVVVFPSKYPHQARPAFEAGAMRKTIIMSRFEATFENVRDSYNGLYFKAGDARDLAQCITRVLRDDSLRKMLEENNSVEALKNHNIMDFRIKIDALMNEFFDDDEIGNYMQKTGGSQDDP